MPFWRIGWHEAWCWWYREWWTFGVRFPFYVPYRDFWIYRL